MALHLIDVEATKSRHFANKRSRVLKDGREILYGNDWKERKLELWARSNGRCEWLEPGIILARRGTSLLIDNGRCTAEAQDPHHKVNRSKLRDDRLEGLLAVCRFHHRQLDPRKIRWSTAGAKAENAIKGTSTSPDSA